MAGAWGYAMVYYGGQYFTLNYHALCLKYFIPVYLFDALGAKGFH